MAKIKDKVKNALDEARMLVLGAQVLVGFQFRSVFEPGFDQLPLLSQLLKLLGLGLMLLGGGPGGDAAGGDVLVRHRDLREARAQGRDRGGEGGERDGGTEVRRAERER